MKSIVNLGMFDGVHTGHRKLFDISREIKAQYGYKTTAYTFENHPREFFGIKPPLLMTTSERIRAIKDCGIDEIITDRFDNTLCNTSCEDFVDMLKKRFSPAYIVVGYNYTFGKNGKGDAKTLTDICKTFGTQVIVVPPVIKDGQTVSSHRIRQAIETGDIRTANEMLTQPYRMSGIVRHGRKVGRQIGFPTANIINEHEKVLPLFGVYETNVCIDGKNFRGITNVGNNPTFGELPGSIETNILDFSDDIYGVDIVVEFIRFIRPQRKFESVDELIEQIRTDKASLQ